MRSAAVYLLNLTPVGYTLIRHSSRLRIYLINAKQSESFGLYSIPLVCRGLFI